MIWTPPVFDPKGACTCVRGHQPRLMTVETHHMLPLGWGGTDTADNKVRVCPNTHFGAHSLLNEYVRAGAVPPAATLKRFSQPAQWLADYAWQRRIPGHPTPYWLHWEPAQ